MHRFILRVACLGLALLAAGVSVDGSAADTSDAKSGRKDDAYDERPIVPVVFLISRALGPARSAT